MQDILERIAKADTYATDMIFQAALERKRELYPDWELLYCAIPQKAAVRFEEKRRQIEELMKNMVEE